MGCCTRCGSSRLPCGCCEGTQVLTPAAILNRPGLPALSYRVGTHGSFLETMKARLATTEVGGIGADGQPSDPFRPLAALTTRDSADFTIALLDGWATVADLLSFYQERIANEGYLRTATERRSILELARLVGYALRPGVAASVYLAFTIDDNQVDPAIVPLGTRVQSLPGPGEKPQSFETSEDLPARREWNNLQVRMTQPQVITIDNVLQIPSITVTDAVNSLRPGDTILLLFSTDGTRAALRSVHSVDGPSPDGKWTIAFEPLDAALALTAGLLADLVAKLEPFVAGADPPTGRVVDAAQHALASALLDHAGSPADWATSILDHADGPVQTAVQTLVQAFGSSVAGHLGGAGGGGRPMTSGPDQFVAGLLQPRIVQAANSLQLRRDLGQAFASGADTAPQLLLKFAPVLADSYYKAWAGAVVPTAAPTLQGVYALRTSAALFGATVPKQAQIGTPQGDWQEWTLDGESTDGLFLDQLYPAIAAPGFAVVTILSGGTPATQVLPVTQATASQRSAYGISGKSTHLTFARDWWQALTPPPGSRSPNDMPTLRAAFVRAQSQALMLAEEPVSDEVAGSSLVLGTLQQALTSGRWVIVSGERSDIPGVSGVRAAELMMVSGLVHGFDATLPGDRAHTTLQLATPLAYRYRRDTVTVYANVVEATQGETRNEILGSGDATRALQSFTLKKPPLTFVPAATAAGAASTLAVTVDGAPWTETASLSTLGPKDRGYTTATDDSGVTTLTFGDGVHGERLPTGVQNLLAAYRSGIGTGGNVRAEQISLLSTRPLGVKAVINPLAAAGGTDPEDRDLARQNAPLAVTALDRLVSVQDYADFTRTFAGIAKAVATKTSSSGRDLLFLTIAGAADAPIDKTSALYRNLRAALRKQGDPDLALRVEPRELLALVLSAKVALQDGYVWETVAAAVRAQLLAAFGFGARALGQPVRTAEVIAVMQAVRGVAWIDLDAFGAVPQAVTVNGVRQLVTQTEVSAAVTRAVASRFGKGRAVFESGAIATRRRGLPPDVIAFPGGNDGALLRPAQLAVFTDAVADAIVLTQTK